MYQKVIIIGNVGRDPNFRYTPQGIAVCDFSVAVNKKRGKGENRRETTTWFRVTVWRDYAEVASKYIRKGMKVMVEGEINATAYIAKDGTAQPTLEITCQEFKMLDRRDDSDEPTTQTSQGEPAAAGEVADDDIPF